MARRQHHQHYIVTPAWCQIRPRLHLPVSCREARQMEESQHIRGPANGVQNRCFVDDCYWKVEICWNSTSYTPTATYRSSVRQTYPAWCQHHAAALVYSNPTCLTRNVVFVALFFLGLLGVSFCIVSRRPRNAQDPVLWGTGSANGNLKSTRVVGKPWSANASCPVCASIGSFARLCLKSPRWKRAANQSWGHLCSEVVCN